MRLHAHHPAKQPRRRPNNRMEQNPQIPMTESGLQRNELSQAIQRKKNLRLAELSQGPIPANTPSVQRKTNAENGDAELLNNNPISTPDAGIISQVIQDGKKKGDVIQILHLVEVLSREEKWETFKDMDSPSVAAAEKCIADAGYTYLYQLITQDTLVGLGSPTSLLEQLQLAMTQDAPSGQGAPTSELSSGKIVLAVTALYQLSRIAPLLEEISDAVIAMAPDITTKLGQNDIGFFLLGLVLGLSTTKEANSRVSANSNATHVPPDKDLDIGAPEKGSNKNMAIPFGNVSTHHNFKLTSAIMDLGGEPKGNAYRIRYEGPFSESAHWVSFIMRNIQLRDQDMNAMGDPYVAEYSTSSGGEQFKASYTLAKDFQNPQQNEISPEHITTATTPYWEESAIGVKKSAPTGSGSGESSMLDAPSNAKDYVNRYFKQLEATGDWKKHRASAKFITSDAHFVAYLLFGYRPITKVSFTQRYIFEVSDKGTSTPLKSEMLDYRQDRTTAMDQVFYERIVQDFEELVYIKHQ